MSSPSPENMTAQQIFEAILTPVCKRFWNRFNHGIYAYTEPLCDFVQYYLKDSLDMVTPLKKFMLERGYELKMDTRLVRHVFSYTKELYFASTSLPLDRIIQITITASASSDPEGRGMTVLMIATVDPDYVTDNYVSSIFDTARRRKKAATGPYFYEQVYLNPINENAFDQIQALIDTHRKQENSTLKNHKWSTLEKVHERVPIHGDRVFHCSKDTATGVIDIKFTLSWLRRASDPPLLKLFVAVRFDETPRIQASTRYGGGGMRCL